MKAEARSKRTRSDAAAEGAGRRTTAKSKKREQEIIDTAAELFHRQGYADTSVQDVADAVGILKGSLYYYIDSKEDLLFRVLSEVHEDASTIVADIEALDAPPLDRLREYVRRHIEYNAKNLTKIAVYYHDFGLLTEDRRKAILKQRAIYQDLVEGLIAEAQELGQIDPSIDPRLASNAVFGMVNWVYTWYRPGGPAAPEDVGRLYAEIMVNGLTGAKVAAPVGKPGRARRAAARKAS